MEMASKEKQKAKLQERIERMESELKTSLQKKSAGKAIDVPKYTREIASLKAQLAAM
jgi:uncharacterized small protein (DUF1192 family)